RAESVRRGWAACDPLYVSAPYASVSSGALPRKDSGLFIADPGVAVVGVKPADDRTGAVVKLVDLTGVARAVAVWPGAYGFRGARRANFVEMNGDRVPVAPDGHVTIDLPAWGAAARSEEHTSELQSPDHLVCRLLLEKKNKWIACARALGQEPCYGWTCP